MPEPAPVAEATPEPMPEASDDEAFSVSEGLLAGSPAGAEAEAGGHAEHRTEHGEGVEFEVLRQRGDVGGEQHHADPGLARVEDGRELLEPEGARCSARPGLVRGPGHHHCDRLADEVDRRGGEELLVLDIDVLDVDGDLTHVRTATADLPAAVFLVVQTQVRGQVGIPVREPFDVVGLDLQGNVVPGGLEFVTAHARVVFLGILVAGLAYVWRRGALEWGDK